MMPEPRSIRGRLFGFLFLALVGLFFWISGGSQEPEAQNNQERLAPAAAPAKEEVAATAEEVPAAEIAPASKEPVHETAEPVHETAEPVHETAEPVRKLAKNSAPYSPTTDLSEEEANGDQEAVEERNKEELRIRNLRNGNQ